jgi:hypothetical protein
MGMKWRVASWPEFIMSPVGQTSAYAQRFYRATFVARNCEQQ